MISIGTPPVGEFLWFNAFLGGLFGPDNATDYSEEGIFLAWSVVDVSRDLSFSINSIVDCRINALLR